MKKLLLIPALLGTMAMANEYKYEVTPLVGYDITEGNTDLDNYMVYGAEIQFNDVASKIKPELMLLYSVADYNTYKLLSNADTEVARIAFNGVYEYEKVGSITPIVKAGLGYESMYSGSYTKETGNEASVFADAGVGAKIPLKDNISLKVEALYMLKYNADRYDNNLVVSAGLNIAFGKKAQRAMPQEVEIVQEIVDLDDDNDGVLNSKDKCPFTLDSVEVDANGCAIDKDKDGVVDSVDKCLNTPVNTKVNNEGCAYSAILNINFDNNSAKVQQNSYDVITTYADFLKDTGYGAKIIGHTDSRGSSAYNKKLSKKRADAVVAILVEDGVDGSKLQSVGMGEAEPIATNDTAEGRAKNRRIEAKITK